MACAGSPVRTEGDAARNRANLLQLSVGQTKSQVAAIMGTPYKTEMYSRENGQIEFWLYLTEAGVSDDSHFTPLAFENGVLQGWGRNYYDTTLRVKKEVTTKQE
jgi:hypothetical protein